MSKGLLTKLAIFGLAGFLAVKARADDAPVNLKCNLQFNVKFGPANGENCGRAPWYAYFPYDPHVIAPTRPIGTYFPNWPYCPAPIDPTGGETSTQSRYPNWPTQPMAGRIASPPPMSNIVLTGGTAPVYRPVSYAPPHAWYYRPAPAPYWYGR